MHEWPKCYDTEPVALTLRFDTDLPQMVYNHADKESSAIVVPESRGIRDYGVMRYILRAFPIVDGTPLKEYSDEFVFTREVSNGYDCTTTLELAPGSYRIMVWADLSEFSDTQKFYNTGNYGEITLDGAHAPNTDYRDAFRGWVDVTLEATIELHEPVGATIDMARPLAKFEFITNDLREFFEKEASRMARSGNEDNNDTQSASTAESRVALDDYEVVFSYVGYMPCAYSMFTDKPVDSKTGVFFRSKLSRISDDDASLGFDYVFVNGSQTAVTIQIALYSAEGVQVSLTEPIEVPLRRSYHTIILGSFLMTQANGGTGIDPDYDGDFNLFM